MYEQIDEPIEVLAGFFKNQTRPMIIRWNNKKYIINKVNLMHHNFEGRDKVYYFSVSDQANYFKLKFNSSSLEWRLMEVYFSG